MDQQVNADPTQSPKQSTIYRRKATMAPTPARPAPTLATRPLAAPVKVATAGLTGETPHEGPVVVAVVAGATGAAEVDHPAGGAGVAVLLHEVETLVKTGTETVQGHSSMVKVVAVETVQVLPW